MKLLLDENLSPKLLRHLITDFPDSSHVERLQMRGCKDTDIWNYAKQHDYIIVSKDDDFRQRSFLSGSPPKVVWLNVGNAGTAIILKLLLDSVARIKEFEADMQESILILNLHQSK